MIGLSEQIRIMEAARRVYAANPSHASRGFMPKGGGDCVNTAIAKVCDKSHWIEMQLVFARSIGSEENIASEMALYTIVFNEVHSTEEVLAAFDQVISELKAKVTTDECVLQVS